MENDLKKTKSLYVFLIVLSSLIVSILLNSDNLELLRIHFFERKTETRTIQSFYPLTFRMPDNTEITLLNERERFKIRQWYENNPKHREEMVMPVRTKLNDGSEIATHSDDEFERVKRYYGTDENQRESEEYLIRVYWTYSEITLYLVLFNFLAFLNFFGFHILNITKIPRKFKILLLILLNSMIFFLLNLLGKSAIDNVFDFEIISLNEILYINLPIAGISIATAYFFIILIKLKHSEYEKAKLREEKNIAQITILKNQISPHFFFNTLSSLSTIVRNKSKDESLEFIQKISETYRYTLTGKLADLVNIKKEINFARSYLEIMKKRFGDKLRFSFADFSEYSDKIIPPMSLQVLVENAVKHNVVTQEVPLNINIYAKDNLLIVENDLQEKENSNGTGIGLKNLSERYKLLSDKKIIIEKEDNKFRAGLPLL